MLVSGGKAHETEDGGYIKREFRGNREGSLGRGSEVEGKGKEANGRTLAKEKREKMPIPSL